MGQSLRLAMVPLAVAETLAWAALYYSFPALLPAWEAAFDWSRAEITGAFTASLIVTGLLAPQAGRLVDKGQSGPMFLGALALGAVLLALLSQVQTLWQFWAIWIAIGLVNAACLYEACFAIITVTIGARAREAITIVTLVAGFAGTVSFPSAWWLSETLGWRDTVLVFAAATLLCTLPIAALGLRLLNNHRMPPSERAPSTGNEGRAALARPTFWWIAIGFGATGLVHGMLISHIRPIMDDRGVAVSVAVLVASMVGPMQVLGRIIMIALGRWVGTFGAAVGSFAGMVLGLSALLSAGMAPWLALVFVVPYGAAYGVTSIVRPVLTADFLGRAGFGVIAGMLAVPYMLGGAAGPILASVLWGLGGYDLVLGLCISLVLCGLAGIVMARRTAT